MLFGYILLLKILYIQVQLTAGYVWTKIFQKVKFFLAKLKRVTGLHCSHTRVLAF